MSTISIGSTNVLSAFKGTTAIKSVYRGAVKLLDFFSPLSLFANGEQGVWYEPSATTAFRSTTDPTPCDYGQSCGFLLDKSQGAGYSGGSFTGPELITNGTFDAGTSGWTFTPPTDFQVVDGKAHVTSPDSVVRRITQAIPTTAGNYYFWEFDYEKNDCNRLWITVGTTAGSGNIQFSELFSASGRYSVLVQAQGSTTYFDLGVYNSTGCTGIFDNVSVKELPGNHATQATADARPILARVPETGRRNLLTYTEDLTNAVWIANNISASGSRLTTTAGGSTVNLPYFGQSGLASGTSMFAIDVKYVDNPWMAINFGGAGTTAVWFNIQTGVKGTESSGYSGTITPLVNGWYRITVTGTSAGSSFIFFADGDGVASGTSGRSVDVRFPQVELGSTATAYQKVVSEYDITEAGVDSLEYLSFDGVDDWMQAGSNSVFNYLHDGTGASVFVAFSPLDASVRGAFLTTESGSSGSTGYTMEQARLGAEDMRHTVNAPAGAVFSTSAGVSDGASVITTVTHAASEDPDVLFRKDGATLSTPNYSLTPATGNSALALCLGRRSISLSDRYWGGYMFTVLFRSVVSTTAEISNTEAYLANRSGVTL